MAAENFEAEQAISFASDANCPEVVKKGLHESVKYMVDRFLEDKHYTTLHSNLAAKWDRSQSLAAAMKLMEQHSVVISPEEQQRLSKMDDSKMIDALVSKMPLQSKEEFQSFFLQLQMMVSTATRIRGALEQGRSDQVKQALDDGSNSGLAQYILKMALVQAGSEVITVKQRHQSWVKESQLAMSKLVHGQGDLMDAQRRLAAAQAELAKHQGDSSAAAKKVLLGMAGGNEKAILKVVYKCWADDVKKTKQEAEIRSEYEDRIVSAEKRLFKFLETRLANVRGVMEKKAAGLDSTLKQEVFDVFKSTVEEKKQDLASLNKVKELEKKLAECAQSQAAAAKQVLAKMSAGSDSALCGVIFQSWVAFHKEYAKEKEMEDRVKAAERQVQEFMKNKSAGAKAVLAKAAQGSDSALVQEVWQAWMAMYREEKKANEMAELLNGSAGKFASFANRNTGSARSVMERAAAHQDMIKMLKVFNAWRLDTKVERMMLTYHGKIDAKRSQLSNVQQMFRRFATDLEKMKLDGPDSTRHETPPMAKGMSRGGGSVSLPDIHSKDPKYQGGRPRSRERA